MRAAEARDFSRDRAGFRVRTGRTRGYSSPRLNETKGAIATGANGASGDPQLLVSNWFPSLVQRTKIVRRVAGFGVPQSWIC
jgi:hypothetical protein